jgi:hypothetical protein
MKVYAQSGESFFEAVKRVQNEMNQDTNAVILEFNDTYVVVSRNSLIYDLATIYDLRNKISRFEQALK